MARWYYFRVWWQVSLSDFTMEVIKYIKENPYGKTITYDVIARKIAKNKNIKRMSVQAVGGTFGRFLKLYL